VKLKFRATTVAAAVLALASVMPATAQQAVLGAKMSVASFEPWGDATRPLQYTIVVTNTGARPIEDPVIRTTIYRRVLSRSALHVALEGRRLRNVVAATTDNIPGPIAPGASVRFPVSHQLTALANVFRQGIGGVYPVEISLSGSDRELATGISAAVFLGEAPKFRLNAAIVLPVHRPAAFDPDDGTYTEEALARDLGASGFVSRTTALLASATDIPLTIAPTGLLLDELDGLADGYRLKGVAAPMGSGDPFARAAARALEELASAAASTAFEIATASYAWADLVPLVHSGLQADVARQLTLGRATVASALGRAPSSEMFVPAGLRMDAQTAEAVGALDVRRMVVAANVVPPQAGIFGPDHPLIAHGAGGLDYPVLLADEATASRLVQPGDADKRLVAQGVVAEAAMAYFERPTLSAGRSFVIAPPVMPHPDITAPVLRALAKAPWIRLRTATDLIGALPTPEERQPLVAGDPASPRFETAVRAAETSIETVAQVIIQPAEITTQLNRLVLASQSYDWVKEPGTALKLAEEARRRARGILDKIAVVPRPDKSDPKRPFRKVTLTSRAGPLPVTVQNDTGFPVTLRVRVTSTKVSFTKDTEVMEEIGKRETVTFTAAARASGLSPVRVELLTCRSAGNAGDATRSGSPTPSAAGKCAGGAGERLIGTGTVLVQSSAVSAVALAATGGGAAFLIAAWIRRGVRRRRNGGTPSGTPGQHGEGETA
jgi:hypothetical protein